MRILPGWPINQVNMLDTAPTHLTSTIHAIMCDSNLLPISHQCSQLTQIRGPWQVEYNMVGNLTQGLIDLLDRVRLHGHEIEDRIRTVSWS